MQALFPFARTREAPESLLEGLRAVRPDVDLLWWGLYGYTAQDQKGKPITAYRPTWLLVVPGAETLMREHAGRALDAWAKAPVGVQHPQKIQLALLRYRGWRPLLAIPTRDPDWAIVEDFAAFDWANRFGGRMMAAVDETEDDPVEQRRAKMREAVHATMKDVWNHVWKGRRSVLQLRRLN